MDFIVYTSSVTIALYIVVYVFAVDAMPFTYVHYCCLHFLWHLRILVFVTLSSLSSSRFRFATAVVAVIVFNVEYSCLLFAHSYSGYYDNDENYCCSDGCYCYYYYCRCCCSCYHLRWWENQAGMLPIFICYFTLRYFPNNYSLKWVEKVIRKNINSEFKV